MAFIELGLSVPAEKRTNPLNNPSVSLASPAAWSWITGSRPTSSGELVSENNSLETLTVYACVRVISESIASLPLKLYERTTNGRNEAIDNPIYRLLAFQPNAEMSSFTFLETMAGCLALTGNAYAQIQRDTKGLPIALWPLHPQRTEPVRLTNGSLAFRTTDGELNGKFRIINAANVLHIPLFSFDGIKGMSPIQLARQTIGAHRAAQKFGAKWFGGGSRPGGILTNKSVSIPEKDLINLRSSFEAANGAENQGRLAVLPGDWTYAAIGVSPEEAQFLQTLQYGRTEIAALFRIPPHMIGDTSRLSNGNHEQSSLSFVTDTLRPYLARFEAEIYRKLLPESGKLFVQFDVRDRLRGDFQTTMDGYSKGRNWGWYSGNDIRRELGENPGGPELDVYLVPVNTMNAARLLDTESTLVAPLNEKPAGDSSVTPTEDERSLLAQYRTGYIRLFSDAVNKLLKRDKRDLSTIASLFEPTLRSILDSSTQRVAGLIASETEDRIVKDALRGIEKRAASCTVEGAEEFAMNELTKVVRSIHLNTHREAAVAVALKELENE